jgi:hypothetical protein
MNVPNSVGVDTNGWPPRSLTSASKAGSTRAAFIALLTDLGRRAARCAKALPASGLVARHGLSHRGHAGQRFLRRFSGDG